MHYNSDMRTDPAEHAPAVDDPFLRSFGERVRAERARRGMSRRLLASQAGISERYISQLETGTGNASLIILRQIAAALAIPMTRLLQDAEGPESLERFVSGLSDAQKAEALELLVRRFTPESAPVPARRIALLGLRGAGKSTLGRRAARALGIPFFELDRQIEQASGASLASVIELYGQQAYRRYELQALRQLIETQEQFVVATGGGIVSESVTYDLLLRECFTVWISATPEEHMQRVIAQGDHRPMAGSDRAMQDLERILEERTPLYAQARAKLDTANRTEQESLDELLSLLPVVPRP